MIGKIINNYEIKSLLGEGGMGAVYLARHPIIDRSVAIKVLKQIGRASCRERVSSKV